MIRFPHCTIEWLPQERLAVTTFPDGTTADACPHETEDYRNHARAKSTGSVDDYCWQHDIAHIIVGLMNGGPSKVLWALAHHEPIDTEECHREEEEAQQFQRDFFLTGG